MRVTLMMCVAAAVAGAQSFTGRIVGTVTDSTGGVVAGSLVKATEVATNRTQTAAANETGNYSLNELTRGEYLIEVSAPGFKQFVRRGIQLSIGQQARVDVRLEVGAVSESVEVVADAGLLETVDSVLGKVVDNKRIPDEAGIYIFGRCHGSKFEALYVGKARPEIPGDRSEQGRRCHLEKDG